MLEVFLRAYIKGYITNKGMFNKTKKYSTNRIP